ncbi:putative GNAT family N-acetyltransferase [Xylariales sp. PMI_506]|nr:putative GNAT family N-acetyltransferase [Xylariales sp. PMI_506]
MSSNELAAGYILREGYPSVEDYLHLRAASGLSPKTADQAAVAMRGSWYGVHVVEESATDSDGGGGGVVAMGRIVGDGGWYFLVADMAVLPAHQRRGLGAAVLRALLARIKEGAARGTAYVTLAADPPGRKLYADHGFREIAPKELGMGLKIPDCGQ